MTERLHVTAETLWTRGAAHLAGARTLRSVAESEAHGQHDPDQIVFNGMYSAAIHLLIGFAFELMLKAAFLAAGGDSNELKKDRP